VFSVVCSCAVILEFFIDGKRLQTGRFGPFTEPTANSRSLRAKRVVQPDLHLVIAVTRVSRPIGL
jgi:hypothetical protein